MSKSKKPDEISKSKQKVVPLEPAEIVPAKEDSEEIVQSKVMKARKELDDFRSLFVSYNATQIHVDKLLVILPEVLSAMEGLNNFAKGTSVEAQCKEIVSSIQASIDLATKGQQKMLGVHSGMVEEQSKKQGKVRALNEKMQKFSDIKLKNQRAIAAHEEKEIKKKQEAKELANKTEALVTMLKNNVERHYGRDNGFYPEALHHARHLLRIKLQEAKNIKEIEAIEWDAMVPKDKISQKAADVLKENGITLDA